MRRQEAGFIDQAARRAVAFFKRSDLLLDLILGHDEILGVETRDIASLAIGNGNVQLHQVDVHKDASVVVLRYRA